MPDPDGLKSLRELDEMRAGFEAMVNEAAVSAKDREDRYVELLEGISKQLAGIEQLLREKLSKSHDR